MKISASIVSPPLQKCSSNIVKRISCSIKFYITDGIIDVWFSTTDFAKRFSFMRIERTHVAAAKYHWRGMVDDHQTSKQWLQIFIVISVTP